MNNIIQIINLNSCQHIPTALMNLVIVYCVINGKVENLNVLKTVLMNLVIVYSVINGKVHTGYII